MQNSKNYNFYLPSRDADDIVDVNQLSENFVKIDSEMSEMLKGKGVDQTYNPESENAQSGKAVAEAVVNYEQNIYEILRENYVKKEQFNSAIGDISTALDELHIYAQALVGGATE